MNTFGTRKAWSDQFVPQVKSLVGPHLVETAPLEWDMKRGVDFTTLRAKLITIACRIRRPKYKQYAGEFTVRYKLPSGVPTEHHKLLDSSFAQWMFYAIAEHDTDPSKGFFCWSLLDLNVFRRCHYKGAAALNPDRRKNDDGTEFLIYDLSVFPPDIFIDRFEPPTNADVAGEWIVF